MSRKEPEKPLTSDKERIFLLKINGGSKRLELYAGFNRTGLVNARQNLRLELASFQPASAVSMYQKNGFFLLYFFYINPIRLFI